MSLFVFLFWSEIHLLYEIMIFKVVYRLDIQILSGFKLICILYLRITEVFCCYPKVHEFYGIRIRNKQAYFGFCFDRKSTYNDRGISDRNNALFDIANLFS